MCAKFIKKRLGRNFCNNHLLKKYGHEKLEEDFLTLKFRGSAGQSFGAFGITSLDARDAIKTIRTIDIMQRGKICIVRERTY